MSIVHECLILIQDMMVFFSENQTERFEVLSERFYQETKIMAPSRSVPLEMAMSQPPDDVRADQYSKWLKKHLKNLHENAADKLARYKCEKCVPDQVRDALRQLHDECCDMGHGKRLDVGPMLMPSEQAVLRARFVLENQT